MHYGLMKWDAMHSLSERLSIFPLITSHMFVAKSIFHADYGYPNNDLIGKS